MSNVLQLNPRAISVAAAAMAGAAPAEPVTVQPISRYHELLIDGLCGIGFKSIAYAKQAEAAGWATFSGNQHNPDWKWNRPRLEAASEKEVLALYINAKTKQ